MTWHDWTVFLLHTAAEIEHALMVQYLFAAYSIDDEASDPSAPAGSRSLVRRWKREVLKIAREEMGHLLCVQNLLKSLGGPMNLQREDFPFRSELYPFPFQLEPLSKHSLAKYIATEMPLVEEPDEELREILQRAHTGGGQTINRVGVLFEELIRVISDPSLLPDTAFAFLPEHQSQREPWRARSSMIMRPIASRADAVAVLEEVAEQGEGDSGDLSQNDNHFARFLAIYRKFPDSWRAVHPVATNPVTAPAEGGVQITEPRTLLWANLGNVHYRRLLAFLALSVSLSGDYELTQEDTIRGRMTRAALFEMAGANRKGGLKGIAEVLARLPAATGGTETAGFPFELPYTLTVPREPHALRLLFSDVLVASKRLLQELEALGVTDANQRQVLDDLKLINSELTDLIEEL